MNWIINCAVLGFLAMGGVFSYQMYSSEQAMNDGTMFDRGVDPWAGKVQVENIREENGYLKDGYVLLARHDELDTSRVADITLFASEKDLLKGSGPVANDSVLPVLIAAGATDLANAECELLMQTIAKACAVNKTDAPVAIEGTDYYQVGFQVAFASKAPFGTFDMAKKWTFDAAKRITLGKKDAIGVKVEPSDQRYTRKQFYQDLARGCVENRKYNEPCSLYSVNVYAQMERKTQKIRMSATGNFASISRVH